MKVLVTGGAGYIGSITAKALEEAGHTPVILDSLLTGPLVFVRNRIFYEGDIADRILLRRVVDEHPDIDATIHMAARIVVPESVEKPYEYYRDNVAKSLELFDELAALGKHRVLFSSSASLYATKASGPTSTTKDPSTSSGHRFEVTEDDPLDPPSPYARTKRMMEQILIDLAAATDLRAIVLRYFNPIGSDPALESGIYVKEPSHVLGQLVMAARGQKDHFTITGVDHPTPDGTGIRDYIHVWDLARAHVRAVERFDDVLAAVGAPSTILNVGRGEGVSVRELVTTFERVVGRSVPIQEAEPRPGDAVGAYANVDRARELLDWTTELSIEEAIASALAWSEKRREVLGYE
jgi:UDP-glucose 4-epimerase